MEDSGGSQSGDSIRALLGLPSSARRARIRSKARRLRVHIEGRLAAAPSEVFADARRQEVARLAENLKKEGLQIGSGSGGRRLALAIGFILGVGAASIGFVFFFSANEGSVPQRSLQGEISVLAEPTNSSWALFHPEDDRLVAEFATDGVSRSFLPGRYRIRVSNEDCPDEWDREIEVVPDELRRYSPRLCQGEGEIVVESNTEGARLMIDGMDVGTTGSDKYPLPVGPHRLRVEKPGFEAWEGKVQVLADRPLTLQAELAPTTEAPSRVGRNPGGPPPARSRPESPVEPPPVRAAAGKTGSAETSSAAGPGAIGKGGSKSWHDAVRHQLVRDYDRNRSGSLDLRDEIQSIPCPVLQNLEASYETGGLAVSMTHLYGFDGSDAPANTLGVTPGMRGYAYDRMKGCGLKTRH
jgi:hypothetical protein